MKKFKIGYTQGTFDMFHVGHLNLLYNARNQCDKLIVGVNSDKLVKEYKDKTPIINENERLAIVQAIQYVDEAVLCGIAKINSEDVILCVMDGNFLMGSMGTVVGEEITYSIEKAIDLHVPIIIFSVSGGARMQEGIMSLMQMAKTSSAIAKANEARILYISVLTDPTYGGVTASFASLGDIILAEPNAMIGFAGPRVIKQTIGEELPQGFQTAEFQLEHGFIDKIVERKDMKEVLYKLIQFNK